MSEFKLPSLGADMTEGTLTEWLVHPGDVVHRGDVIAVVDTVKSAIDIEVFEEGRVEELLVEPGTSVPVGTPLARLLDEFHQHRLGAEIEGDQYAEAEVALGEDLAQGAADELAHAELALAGAGGG